MKEPSNKLVLGVVILVLLAVGIFALKGSLGRSGAPAGPPPGPPPFGAQMGGPPGMPGGSAEFQKSHKYTFQLMRLVGNIGRLEEEGKAPLTPAQAKAALAVLEPLRKRESLDESVAREACKALHGILTDKQRAAIAAIPPERQFRRAGPPPGGPPPGGPPPSGRPPAPNPKAMESFNPLNAPPGGPPNQRGPGGPDKLFDDLRKKSGSG